MVEKLKIIIREPVAQPAPTVFDQIRAARSPASWAIIASDLRYDFQLRMVDPFRTLREKWARLSLKERQDRFMSVADHFAESPSYGE